MREGRVFCNGIAAGVIDVSFISEQQKTQFKELISNRIETLSMPF